MVYLSIITGMFIYDQFNDTQTNKNVNVFLDTPDF